MNLAEWGEFGGLLWLESTVLIAIAGLAARLVGNPRHRAVIWQTLFLALGAVLILRGSTFPGGTLDPDRSRRSVWIGTGVAAPAPQGWDQPNRPDTSQASQPLLPVTTASEAVRWPAWLWFLGTGLLAGRAVWSRRALRLALREARPAPVEIARAVELLREPIGAPRITTLTWRALPGPCVFGIRQPVLAVPAGLEARVPAGQYEAMLAHEVAHVAARDPWWALLSEGIRACLWWNPAVWLARRSLLMASELAADQAAACLPRGQTDLAESLVALGRELAGQPGRRLPVLGGSGLRSGLGRRVEALLNESPRWKRARPLHLWLLRSAALAALLILASPLPHAQLPAPAWTLLSRPPEPAAPGSASEPAASNRVGTVSDVLNDPQFRQVVKQLEAAPQKAPPTPPEAPRVLSERADAAERAGAADTNKIVNLGIKIIEITEPGAAFEIDWLFGPARDKNPVAVAQELGRVPGNPPLEGKDVIIERLGLEEQSAVLQREQFSELLRVLERRAFVDIMAAPRITTISGRPAQLSVTDAHNIVTTHARAGQDLFVTEKISFGQVIEVTPAAAAGDLWQLSVAASLVEFLGYQTDPATRVQRAHIRVRDAAATGTVAEGQTLVIRGVPVTESRRPQAGSPDKPAELRKRLYIFVTPE